MNNTLTQQLKDSFKHYTGMDATVLNGHAILAKYNTTQFSYFVDGTLESDDEGYWITVCNVIRHLWYDTDTSFDNLA